MNIVMMPVQDVKPYENNPRLNRQSVKVVADSIKQFGFKNPIVVDKDHVIIVGHTRLEAGKSLGYKEVPVIVADDLNEEQVKAFRIMDNKSSEFAEWDFEKLSDELNELLNQDFDVMTLGFEDVDLERLLDDLSVDESDLREFIPQPQPQPIKPETKKDILEQNRLLSDSLFANARQNTALNQSPIASNVPTQVAQEEEDEFDLEDVPEALVLDRQSPTTTRSKSVQFGRNHVPVSDEEFEMLEGLYEQYVTEFGVPYGFISYLLGRLK